MNTLGFSRRFHVYAAPRKDVEHTYESLVQTFRYFGGSVKTVLVNNQKTAVLKHSNNGVVIFNAGFLQLAKHYSFIPRASRPLRAQTKGKVEHSHLTDKQEFYQFIDYTDDVDLHEKLAEWEAFYNCHRPHSARGGKTPYEVLKTKLGI